MEALSAATPPVLVLRGCIMGAVAFASAPGPFPLPQAPAQINIEKADARVEILSPIIVSSRLLTDGRSTEISINGTRHPVRRRLVGDRLTSERPATWQFIIDLP
ncbi:hypothetical protein [Sphingorhabdus sp.]|uniref:hypothetical protein n=1 Tax=Sphingorhabdus sp. TaxID=1902408 RepID=UPI0035938C98